ncbi:MAG: phosphoenolpyruvate--protein phosphotransferase [Lachnospiraceae bacterium]
MEIITGKSVFAAIAAGPLHILAKAPKTVKRQHMEDTAQEMHRLLEATAQTKEQLGSLYEKALKEVGESNAAIFEVHQMMLVDEDYQSAIRTMIETQEVNAEYAVAATGDNFAQIFANMDDAYMKERAADVKDISERLIQNLLGDASLVHSFSTPVIIAADDLAPSETVQLEKDKILAFVTTRGSLNSHTAILARTMNIPAILGTKITLDASYQGKMTVVDGFTGEVIIEPEADILEAKLARQREEAEKKVLLQELKGKPDVTRDGRHIKLYANIGSPGDLASVLENDAEGIGLFRSEFLYLAREEYPTENDQFSIYKTVLETMAEKQVIIRTLDIGADKQIDYFALDKEENPAMGYRAIRICLDRPEIFKTQLRALYRASVFGNLAIMFPMIVSVEEIHKIQQLIAEVKTELQTEGLQYKDVPLGIMIETPAAAMISDLLAREVDFFSIGTNDLTQYTLAADRQNPKLESTYDAHHPAILRMIEMVVKNGHEQNIWVGICGELGADTSLTGRFIEMGVDELSVSPAFVLPVRKCIREF